MGHRLWLPAVAIHRLGIVEIAPSPHRCFRTANPCAQSVNGSPAEPVLSRSSRQRLGHHVFTEIMQAVRSLRSRVNLDSYKRKSSVKNLRAELAPEPTLHTEVVTHRNVRHASEPNSGETHRGYNEHIGPQSIGPLQRL